MKSKLDEIKNNLNIDDFINYYSSHNISDTSEHFQISIDKVSQLANELNFKKDQSMINEQIKATKIKTYGSLDNLSKLNAEKRAQTILDKYGTRANYEANKIAKYKETISNKPDTFSYKIKNIDKNEFIDLYINQNKPRTFIKNYYNISEYMLDKIINTFDCHKDKRNAIDLSFQSKYEKFGGRDAYFDYMVNKIKDAKIKHYGSWEEALKNTSEKCKDNWNKKSKNELNNIRLKTIKTNLQKYGVESCYQLPQCRLKGNDSKPNKLFAQLLDQNNIKYEREFPINNRSFDFKVNNILIEINPSMTHNSTYGIYDNEPLPYDYHFNKSILAKEHNYRCIHIWDWDNIDKILALLKEKKTIYARKCVIKIIDKTTLDTFLNDNHIQNTCKKQEIRLGLFNNDELIQVMTFGKPRYNKNYTYELLRLCSASSYLIVGGSQKLFKYFLDTYNPDSIISYCDNSKFTGEIYLKLHFKLLNYGIPTKHWYNIKTKQHITDNFLRQRGFDQLFNTNYGKGMSNEKLMLEHNFIEIYDCGQSVYVYNKLNK